VSRLKPAYDARAADWIVAAVTTFGESVLSLVPDGFPSYVRVFHPAHRHDPEEPSRRGRPIRWSEIAAANGTEVHPAMQLSGLTGLDPYRADAQPGVYDWKPFEGSLLAELAAPLATVLARHTATPLVCWFAVWNGFAATRDDLRRAPRFDVPNRRYFLLEGPVDAVTETTNQAGIWHQSANIWWPNDRAWCVATEIDLNTTYIACAEACRDDILATPELEAFEIDPATGIGWASDLVNPEPQHGSPPS
jgi:hypothetical protein